MSLKMASKRFRTLVHEFKSERGQVHMGMLDMNVASSFCGLAMSVEIRVATSGC